MKILIALVVHAAVSTMVIASGKPDVEVIDPRVISAAVEERREWVVKQAEGDGAWLFARDYEWILTSTVIAEKEATQLAYLFFYSTGTIGGYFDDPRKNAGVFMFRFHSEMGPTEGFPVFVDAKSGVVWQEGQTEKSDMLALIRLFAVRRKNPPNQALEPTSTSVTIPAGAGFAPAVAVAHL
jgi:hypothetical protein